MGIMITGGTGFLGSYIARYLVREQGQKGIVILDKNPNYDRIADIHDQVTVVQADVLEPIEVIDALQKHDVDRIIHMAFIAGSEEPGKALPYLRFQCMATATIYDCARLHGIKRVVNASSHGVYGAAVGSTPVTEDDPPHPGPSLYGTCKVWTEGVAENYNLKYGMEILSLRLQSAYGIGRVGRARSWAGGMLGSTMWKQPNFRANAELAVMGEPVSMPPSETVDDFIHAEDTAQACWLAATADKPKHAVFNVSNEHRPVGDYTRILRELVPDAKITIAPTGRIPLLLANQRIREELGFKPRYTLEEGLAAYVREVAGDAEQPPLAH